MGPQFFHCGNPAPPYALQRTLMASMGPQFFHCGNVHVGWPHPTPPAASMGPQFFHCGNKMIVRLRKRGKQCFNGAAVLSLRKYEHAYALRVAGLSFNGAAVLSLRK